MTVLPPQVEEGGGDEPAPRAGGRPRLLRDNLLVASGTALSRVTGLLRLGALYLALDASLRDVYLLANNTPNIIYELILGGVLTATLVPLFTQDLESGDEASTSAVVSTTLVALLAVTALAFLAAPLLMMLYSLNPGPGVDGHLVFSVGTNLGLLFAPQVFFYGAMALGSALLNARKRFFAAAWAPVLANLVITAMLLSVPVILDDDGGLGLTRAAGDAQLRWLLGIGTTAGVMVMALALLPALRRAGVHLRFRPDWRHPSVRKALTLSGWTVGYVIANQAAAQLVSVLAKPASGEVTNYSTAFMFFQFPHGLLAVSLMTTFQPDLARAVVRRDWARFNERLLLGLRLLGLVIVPAAVGYLALTTTLADAAVDSGLLDADTSSGLRVARILGGFSLGLVGFSAYLFVLRAFYALQDTRTPFLLNCLENGINIALALLLVGPFGVVGLAISYAVAYSVAAVVALAVLIRRHPGFDVRSLVGTYARIAAAAAIMGVIVAAIVAALSTDSDGSLVWAAAASIVGGAVTYIGLITALRVPQDTGLFGRRRPGGAA